MQYIMKAVCSQHSLIIVYVNYISPIVPLLLGQSFLFKFAVATFWHLWQLSGRFRLNWPIKVGRIVVNWKRHVRLKAPWHVSFSNKWQLCLSRSLHFGLPDEWKPLEIWQKYIKKLSQANQKLCLVVPSTESTVTTVSNIRRCRLRKFHQCYMYL